jgi:nucleotide-binding universal stress UspA family protein
MKILLAVDGSKHSDVAAREMGLRPWPPDTMVRVLYVLPTSVLAPAAYAPPPAMAIGPSAPAWPPAVMEMQKALADRGNTMTEAIADELRARGLDADIKVRQGDARSEILDEARQWPADLIIMGSHGYTGLKRWLLGSVAQSVVSHAPCSVEIVRGELSSQASLE